jgi:hypothetical protein
MEGLLFMMDTLAAILLAYWMVRYEAIGDKSSIGGLFSYRTGSQPASPRKERGRRTAVR